MLVINLKMLNHLMSNRWAFVTVYLLLTWPHSLLSNNLLWESSDYQSSARWISESEGDTSMWLWAWSLLNIWRAKIIPFDLASDLAEDAESLLRPSDWSPRRRTTATDTRISWFEYLTSRRTACAHLAVSWHSVPRSDWYRPFCTTCHQNARRCRELLQY